MELDGTILTIVALVVAALLGAYLYEMRHLWAREENRRKRRLEQIEVLVVALLIVAVGIVFAVSGGELLAMGAILSVTGAVLAVSLGHMLLKK